MKLNKKISLGVIIWSVICIIFLIGMLINSYKHWHPNVKVGDIWVQEYFDKNPYKETIRDTIVIIDTNGDYCLYVNNRGDTISKTKRWTVVCGRKIKNDNN